MIFRGTKSVKEGSDPPEQFWRYDVVKPTKTSLIGRSEATATPHKHWRFEEALLLFRSPPPLPT